MTFFEVLTDIVDKNNCIIVWVDLERRRVFTWDMGENVSDWVVGNRPESYWVVQEERPVPAICAGTHEPLIEARKFAREWE